MSFLNRYFLIGLCGAAVPILIHLLTRDRVRRVAFSTLRFFANASRNVLRRKRIYEMILLAMRTAACALLAIAFARPFLRSGEAGPGGLFTPGTARVIAVDLSASMGREGMITALREEALTALNSLSEGSDAAALVTFTDTAHVEVPMTQRLGEVRAKLATLAPGHGGTRIAPAVQQADTLLRPVKARAKEVCLISDLQRTGWSDFQGDWKLAPGVKLVVLPVVFGVRALARTPEGEVRPEGRTPNEIAIVEGDCPQSVAMSRSPRTIAVRVALFAGASKKVDAERPMNRPHAERRDEQDKKAERRDESEKKAERRDVEVALSMGGKEVASQKVSLYPGAKVPVRFRRVLDAAGDNPGVVRVKADDAVAADNEFYFNVRVIPRIRVAILNGRPTSSPATDAAYFLKTALAPTEDTPFVAKSIEATRVPPEEIQEARVAILANVGDVAPPVRDALAALVKRGGGILFLPGDRVDAETFNRVFGDLAPCRLRRILTPTARAGEKGEASITRVDYEHPIFETFRHPHHGDLSGPRFAQFWEVTDSQFSRVLARFDDGRPALLERRADAGTSMMLVNPADLQWSNLPLRAIFLPLLHETVRYLAIRTEGRTAFHVGERLPVPEGCRLRGPDGKVFETTDVVAAQPGLHAVLDKDGKEVFQFAVNRDPAEADPATVEPQEIVAALERVQGEVLTGEENAPASQRPSRQDEAGLWWYVLAAVVLLSTGELVLGNHTVRH